MLWASTKNKIVSDKSGWNLWSGNPGAPCHFFTKKRKNKSKSVVSLDKKRDRVRQISLKPLIWKSRCSMPFYFAKIKQEVKKSCEPRQKRGCFRVLWRSFLHFFKSLSFTTRIPDRRFRDLRVMIKLSLDGNPDDPCEKVETSDLEFARQQLLSDQLLSQKVPKRPKLSKIPPFEIFVYLKKEEL